jgi:dihydropteridine reductase
MGMLVLTGSLLAFKEDTPSMLAYGVSKNMVHSLALNMSTRKDLTSENIVICILPDILNTEANRKAMPSADFSKWVQPDKIADLIFKWNQGINTPKNGSFVGFKLGTQVTQEYL